MRQNRPICHPDYADNLELHKPEDLTRTRILGAATRTDAWSEWLAVMGRPDLNLQVHESYEHHYLLIQAASYGLGIAMAPRILVADEIEQGHLVAPLGFAQGTRELHLWIAPHVRSREDVRRLSGWIQHEMTRHATSGTGAAAEDDQRVTTASEGRTKSGSRPAAVEHASSTAVTRLSAPQTNYPVHA